MKAISGVQTVRFKNELERNITIKLGYANAKVRFRFSDSNSRTELTYKPATDLQVPEPGVRAAGQLPILLVRQGGSPTM